MDARQSRTEMSDFLDRYGEQLRRARQRQRPRRRRLRAFAAGPRSARQSVVLAFSAMVFLGALTTLALTRSTAPRPAGAPSDLIASVPENEALEHAGGAT